MTSGITEQGDAPHSAPAAQNDCLSINRLVEEYIPLVQHIVNRFRRDALDSEDLLQEGLIGLLYAARTFDARRGAAFSTFAYRCVLNRILTAVESADRQLHGVSLSEWEGEAPSYTDRPINDPQEIVVAREEILRWTEHAQKLLSDLEQKVFSLYLRGYSYCEMSEILQTSEKTIDNALQRVRKKMREGHELR